MLLKDPCKGTAADIVSLAYGTKVTWAADMGHIVPHGYGTNVTWAAQYYKRKFRETLNFEYLYSCALPLSKTTWKLAICGHCCSLPKTSGGKVNSSQT